MNFLRLAGTPGLLPGRARFVLAASVAVLILYGCGDDSKSNAPRDDRAQLRQIVRDISADGARACELGVVTAKFIAGNGGRQTCSLFVPPITHDLEILSIKITGAGAGAEAEVEVDGPDLTSDTGTLFFVRDPEDATRWLLDEFS